MIRLFAALAIPFEVAEALARRQQGLPGARWSRLEDLHVTLRYFGEVDEATAADLDAALAAVAMESFEVELAGVGAFGAADRVRAVWAGVPESEPLRRLAGKCETAARRCGLKAEARAFRPHVTLAYLKRAPEPRVAAWVQGHNLLHSPPWRARAFHLYSSWRPAEGARAESALAEGGRYEIERTYPLS